MIPREDFFPRIDGSLALLLEEQDLRLFGVAAVPAGSGGAAVAAAARSEYGAWIGAGHHGEMDYLERHADLKYAPERVLAGCRSVLVVGCNYYQRPRRDREPGTGRVARYAWGRDYHNALGKRLKRVVRVLRERYPDEHFRSFVDASPLSERFFAEQAGIGYTGRHTLTISSVYGSWFFLGEILTTLELESTPIDRPRHGACPTSCFRCGTACPTNALYDHHRINARRCISYLTIEHRGPIPEELRPLMGDWVFGCDLCQEACPLNVRAKETSLADFRAHRAGERLDLGEILAIETREAYRDRFAGTPLLRPGREAMVRNACIAAANTGSVHLLPRLRELSNDSSPLVREHARWAVDRLE
ncbi:MAG: tRNA epoxyqueuosine(34) reductase QueG [Spirochaetota bacterium]